jgi:U3 small nucleolar RNA-associated protein 14
MHACCVKLAGLQERLTLKHKNSSKWARRALKRGQGAMEPSMREALAAQLALGQQLRARVEGRRGSGSEQGSGDDDRWVGKWLVRQQWGAL